jgi:hypothetical protein
MVPYGAVLAPPRWPSCTRGRAPAALAKDRAVRGLRDPRSLGRWTSAEDAALREGLNFGEELEGGRRGLGRPPQLHHVGRVVCVAAVVKRGEELRKVLTEFALIVD